MVLMLASDQLPMVAAVPLKVTPPQPCAAPKLAPETMTDDPTTPEFSEREVMLGEGTTAKLSGLLAVPPEVVTTTLPLVAPAGTGATIDVGVQLTT